MTDKELIKIIGGLKEKIQPDEKWLDESRSLLLSEIEAERMTAKKSRKLFWLRLADTFVPANLTLRPAATFSLVLGLFLITSFATVNASKNTLPGSPLYNVKVMAEKVRYFLAFSDEARTRASLNIAQKRAEELSQLMTMAEGENKELLGAVVSNQLTGELNNLKEKLVKMKSEEKDVAKMAAMAKEIDGQVMAIEKSLEAVGDVKSVLAKTEEVKFVILSTYVNQYNSGAKDLDLAGMEKKMTEQIEQVLMRAEKLTLTNKEDQENLSLAKELLKDAKNILADDLSLAWLKLQQANEIISKLEQEINGEVRGESVDSENSTTTSAMTEVGGGTNATTTGTSNGDIILDDWMKSQSEKEKINEFKVEIR
jgi:DNA-binding FrmR family transcriptional regulator